MRLWWLLPALVIAVFAAYQPVWTAGFIWDDDGHMTPRLLRSLRGLWAIWFIPGAAQQYYPLTHSVFWVMNRLFGQDPTAYHLLNIALHAANALLVFAVLTRLRVRCAALAAVVFALHPVMVESVAWISEIKNTLSALFYLSALWVYLRYAEEKRRGDYLLAFLLFFCALLSKTVTASLPAALLVIFWWQRGRLSWRREVEPLIPFFAAGIIMGLFTACVEKYQIGASGSDFEYTLVERCLIAGRVVWFYAGKLVWPVDLVFVYPRWHISQSEAVQYLWPLAAMIAVAGLCWLARRRRGPLAAALFFGGTLFPALGFVDVFPFQYSFVADHFQYLASLGVIVLLAAGVSELLRAPRLVFAAGVVLAGVYGTISFKLSRSYDDEVALYTHTLEVNPHAALAHLNLANFYVKVDEDETGLRHYQQANALRPGDPKILSNLGVISGKLKKYPEAIGYFEEALEILPSLPEARVGLANVFIQQGDLRRAAAQLRMALAVSPYNARSRSTLGKLWIDLGYEQQGLRELRIARRLDPLNVTIERLLDDAESRLNAK